MRCPFCGQGIKPKNAWKSASGRLYCSEFCADSETVVPLRRKTSEIIMPLRRKAVQKQEIDRQYRERLERLLPLRRALQVH